MLGKSSSTDNNVISENLTMKKISLNSQSEEL